MKKEYTEILTELYSNPDYYELDTFIGELCVKNIFNDKSLLKINKQESLPERRLTVFNCLKEHEDSVLGDVEEIFERNKWTHGFQLIQLKREEVNNLMNSKVQEPFLFAVKKPTFFFTGREEKIEQIHQIINQNIVEQDYNRITTLVISGLGGIGKTQLVLSYIHKYKDSFNSIVWINAESEIALTTSFNNLALKLNITLQNLGFQAIAKQVAQKISTFGDKNLFVFDNADEFNPNEFLPQDFENHFFLITSRHQCWNNDSTIINLEALTEEEAVLFVERTLEEIQVKEADGIRDFVSALGCFPLALRQATSYIKRKSELNNQRYTFKEYVAEIEANAENAKRLQSFVPEDILSNGTSEATMLHTISTWQITFNKIKGMQYKSQSRAKIGGADSENADINTTNESLPSRILNICAYLLSDNIPVNLFFTATSQNEEELSWAIDILTKYSLVTITQQGMMKVHKLVQQVTQLNLLDKKQSDKFIENAIDILLKKYYLYEESLEAISAKQTLLPHLMQLKKYVANLKQHQFYIICSLFNCIIEICDKIREPKIKKNVGEELLSIQEKHYVSDCPEIASTLVNLANAFGDLGDSQTKKSLLERALKIKEHHYGPDHFQVAITLNNLACAFGDLGDLQTKKSLLERALKIEESHYGPDHFQLASTLGNLACAFGDLGDSQTMKSLLERALKIKEHHYGPDHFEVAITLVNLACSFGDLGDSLTKKSLLERALKIQEHHYGPDHFQVAVTLGNLANAFGDLGDSQTKESLLARTLKNQEQYYGSDHYQVAITLVNLANAFGDLGDSQMKESLLERALKIQEHHYDINSYRIAITRYFLADCKISLKKFQDAKELLENVLPIFEQLYGKSHQYVNTTQRRLHVCKGLIDSQKRIDSFHRRPMSQKYTML